MIMGKGGARVGAGRKPKDGALAGLEGSRRRPTVVRFPGPVMPAEPVPPPAELGGKPLLVWQELAPFAHAALTLTPETAAAFMMLCRAVALERGLAKSKEKGGTNHRGMMQRVDAGMKSFRLSPMGKAFAVPAVAVDPFEEFDSKQQA